MVPSLQRLLDNASVLPTEIKHEIVSFSTTNHFLASWALVDRAFNDIAERVLYRSIALDSQSTNTMACLRTLRSNPCKAGLVESMGIIFSGSGLLPLDLLEDLGCVVQNTSKLRHLDLDWICPDNMDDPGLKIVDAILTTHGLSLTTLHCGGEIDFARIVRHNQSLKLLGVHHARLEDDELRFSFREMFSPTENPGDRRTRLQPYYPQAGTTANAKKRFSLSHIFILSTYGKSREALHHGITIFPGLYPIMLDGMVQNIFDHLTSPRVRDTLPIHDLVSNIEFATVCWLALPPFLAVSKLFAELQSCFPRITTLTVKLKDDISAADLTKLRDSICVMSQLECLELHKWETNDSTEFHASAEARLQFATHWGAVLPSLNTMYAFDNFHLKRVDGKWMGVTYSRA